LRIEWTCAAIRVSTTRAMMNLTQYANGQFDLLLDLTNCKLSECKGVKHVTLVSDEEFDKKKKLHESLRHEMHLTFVPVEDVPVTLEICISRRDNSISNKISCTPYAFGDPKQ
jgi:hypothetical protein